jgi:hypothetical protein
MREEEVPLAGGVANLGKVVRVGDTVRRPAGPFSEGIAAFLAHLRAAGFDGVAEPLGRDEEGRDIFAFVEGDVPISPMPAWSMTDEALASVARLQRRFHEAAESFDPTPYVWSDELGDPRGGGLTTHNDICPENVVFRDGRAVAILDWDFAAPGRPLWDVTAVMAMWGPVRDPSDPVSGMEGLDPFARARVIADAYGLGADARSAIPEVFFDRLDLSLVEKRAAAGEQAFVEMLARQGGPGRGARRRRWLEDNIDYLRAALA